MVHRDGSRISGKGVCACVCVCGGGGGPMYNGVGIVSLFSNFIYIGYLKTEARGFKRTH